MSEEVHVGDIGTVFELTIMTGSNAVDVSGATTKQLVFQKPGGSTVTKTAAFTTNGTDGKIQYTTVANDLDVAGVWHVQAYVALAAWTGHSECVTFEVLGNLA